MEVAHFGKSSKEAVEAMLDLLPLASFLRLLLSFSIECSASGNALLEHRIVIRTYCCVSLEIGKQVRIREPKLYPFPALGFSLFQGHRAWDRGR